MRFTLRNWIMLGVFAALLVLIGTPIGYVWFGMSNSGGSGSMSEAVKLRPVVEAMPEPTETSVDRKAETVGIRFPNGEWVTGVTKDSHGLYSKWYGGGTVVLKDSRERVRCFFGHVCGVGNFMFGGEPASLDEFDAALAKTKFAEQPWP